MCCRELRPTQAQLAEAPAIAAKLRQEATADRLLGLHRHAAHHLNLADLIERCVAAFREGAELEGIDDASAEGSEPDGSPADDDSIELNIGTRDAEALDVIPTMIDDLEELAEQRLDEGREEAAERAVAMARCSKPSEATSKPPQSSAPTNAPAAPRIRLSVAPQAIR
jgi:hypothetical protein